MPVQRTVTERTRTTSSFHEGSNGINSKYFNDANTPKEDANVLSSGIGDVIVQTETIASLGTDQTVIEYPVTTEHRAAYRTKAGKKLTPHQWDVYDFTLSIPEGKVTTYKDVALSAGGSARSVGSALRNNPFPPYVPCHRVIASNMFIGGFFGEWGKDHKTGMRYNQKVDILAQEGVHFNDRGHLLTPDKNLWKPKV